MKKTISLFIVFLAVLVFLCSTLVFAPGPAAALQAASSETGEIYLHTGSPLILSQDKISFLDPEDLDAAAIVENGRTLVPLGAISKYFNAEVSYDTAKHSAVIGFEGKQFTFPIGEKKYIESGGKSEKTFLLDVPSKIINGRTMVPLKVICENVLGRKVSYYNGVIAISDSIVVLKQDTALVSMVKSKIGTALKVDSLQQLKASMAPEILLYGKNVMAEAELNGTASEKTDEAAGSPASSTSDSGYSTTNIQVEGIDEADIVKTDGKRIYIAGNHSVRIVGTDKGKMEELAALKLPEDKNVQEIYIDGERLILVGIRYERPINDYSNDKSQSSVKDIPAVEDTLTFEKRIMPYYSKTYSFVDIYDVSSPDTPVFIKGHEIEGNYQTSRKNGDMVYLITNTYVYNGAVVPLTRELPGDSAPVPLQLKDILIMPDYPASGYVIVSAVNIKTSEKTQVEAIAAAGHQVYMNASSLYLAAGRYDGTTAITKFKIDGMNIGYAGSGIIKGNILNQFSMDEYKGYLRVAANWNNENNLYVLDDSLNVYGSVTGLAKNERIYSVRFIGDTGYVVTFRNIDPLFVFDLSDPARPVVTGELKIPGFSNYLHPIGDNLILGIGQDTYDIYKKDAQGNDVVVGTRQGGIKLSLFDVSDMGKPKEISNYILGDSGSYADILYDHRAAMFDSSSSNVAFDASVTDTAGKNKSGAAIFSYSDRTIKLKGLLEQTESWNYGGVDIPYARRVLYIGSELYYIRDGVISSYDYKTLAPVANLKLQ